nr:unnamed protein product [Callosobruchus analis]
MLAVLNRYLASGCTFTDLHYNYRLGVSTVSMIFKEECRSIWAIMQMECIPIPTKDLWQTVADNFEQKSKLSELVRGSRWKTHQNNTTPWLFDHNYKGYASIVLMAVELIDYKFLNVDVGAYGRQSDSGVFSESNLFQHMETGSFPFPQPIQIPGSTMTLPYVILGDQGYPLKKYLLRPYPTGTAERPRETEIYNYRLSRARRTVECAFGILVSKWRCLKTELQVEPHHVDKLVLTACLLHNILIDKEGLDEGVLQKIDSKNIVDNARSTVTGPRCYNRAGRDAYYIRDQFKIFFNTVGATNFQDHQIDTYVQ